MVAVIFNKWHACPGSYKNDQRGWQGLVETDSDWQRLGEAGKATGEGCREAKLAQKQTG